MKNVNDNHVSTRVDIEVKREGLQLADQIERAPAWVFAKAIELGLPLVKKVYPPTAKQNKSSRAA